MPIFTYYLFIDNTTRVFLMVSCRQICKEKTEPQKYSFETVKRAKRSEGEIGGLTLQGSFHYA